MNPGRTSAGTGGSLASKPPRRPAEPLRVLLLGRKVVAAKALEFLLERGARVLAVVGEPDDAPVHWSPRLVDVARQHGVPVTTDEEIYRRLASDQLEDASSFSLRDVDLVASVTFRGRLRVPLLRLPRVACVNFHPAPLPAYRGYVGYSFGILDGVSRWAVTAHHVDESFDTGDIVSSIEFDVDPHAETAYSLEQRSAPRLLDLFKRVYHQAEQERRLPRMPQGSGRYFSREDFERSRRVNATDTPDVVERKIRAFWYPPHEGAAIRVGEREYTLASNHVLREAGAKYHS